MIQFTKTSKFNRDSDRLARKFNTFTLELDKSITDSAAGGLRVRNALHNNAHADHQYVHYT